MKQDWTEVMREKLQESAATPPADLWPGISSHLDRAAAPTWRRWAAAAACVAVLMGGGIYLAGTRTDVAQTYAVSEERGLSKPMVAKTTARECVKAEEPVVAGGRDVPRGAETVVVEDCVPVMAESPDTTVRTPAVTEKRLVAVAATATPLREAESAAKSSRKRLSLSLYASNVATKTSSASNYNGGDWIYGWGSENEKPLEGQDETGTRGAATRDGHFLTGAHHKLPVNLGTMVRLPLSESFSLSAGLTYSRLSSTLTWMSVQRHVLKTDQTLHYIGIPLSVDYSLPSYKRLSFYLTAGGVAEKCVYGKSTAENAPTTERISEKQLQFSLFAGAGVQYNLTRTVGLYVEPLASYYFDNHSAVSNIYKDRPLNLDLRLGLRVTLH